MPPEPLLRALRGCPRPARIGFPFWTLLARQGFGPAPGCEDIDDHDVLIPDPRLALSAGRPTSVAPRLVEYPALLSSDCGLPRD